MAGQIGYDVVESTAFLSVAHPPVNALSRPVRVGLSAALDRALADPAVRSIVICGAGSTFPAGAELSELDNTEAQSKPYLRDLCNQVEEAPKPVIAVLHGTVFGGGFELALAAHYRIAAPKTRLSMPELKLGLVPGGGATQRLPRLVGAKRALDVLLDCPIVQADHLVGAPFVDQVFQGEMQQAALEFAATHQEPRRLADSRAGFDDMPAYQGAISSRRKDAKHQSEAAQRVIDLVEAAPMLPFDIGLAMEEEAHETSLASDEAKALRHNFVAEHKARRGAKPEASPNMNVIAVLGAGPLAMQITVSALNVGMGVHWGAQDAERLAEGQAQIREIFQKGVESGGLAQSVADARLAQLKTGTSAEMVEGADMILHAARGQGAVPAPRHMVRAVAMAARVDALGLRFAPPVFATRLVEIVQGPECAPHQLAAAQALAQKLGKVPVVVRSTGESIAGRLATALQRAADGLIDMGANPYAVDAAMTEWGWSKPPFQSRDTLGLETLAQAKRGPGATNWSATLVEVGRKGWVSGAGFYDWGPQGAKPSDAVPRLLNGARQPKQWEAEEMRLLLLGALANEGSRMLTEGMAQSAADIDLVSTLAQEFPKAHGGVMKAVSQLGLFKTYKALQRFDHPDRDFWQPLAIWQDLFKNGRSFDDV